MKIIIAGTMKRRFARKSCWKPSLAPIASQLTLPASSGAVRSCEGFGEACPTREISVAAPMIGVGSGGEFGSSEGITGLSATELFLASKSHALDHLPDGAQ